MKNKRVIICTLICLLTASALSLTSCSGGHSSDQTTASGTLSGTTPVRPPLTDPDVPTTVPGVEDASGCKVVFADSAGVRYNSNRPLGQRVEKGQTVTFTLQISSFYEGTPTVYAGDLELTPDSENRYSFTVEEDTTITVDGISLKASTMEGSGDASDDPYLITSPIDLLQIAEQVNFGNEAYVNGYYSLQNDIDFEGEEMEIIGNGVMDDAVFAGFFNGNGHTISNYRIESDGAQYVGLFGVLQADVTNSQGGTVHNLHLKDFTVVASATGVSCFCGAMVGYGMGGNLLLCSAENGRVEMYADSNRFAYVGGLIGIQQALDYNSLAYFSSLSYCTSDVQVECNSGSTFAAGGLVGYLSASTQSVTASVNNSYATGNVCGALRTGGLVGYLATGTSVVNSYSTGEVSAQAFATDEASSGEYCYAYAGGVAGYAEFECVISESFSTSELRAKSAINSEYEVTDGILGGAAVPGTYDFGVSSATVYNCRYAKGGVDGDIRLTDGSYLQNELCWNPYDWVLKDGGYPTVNTESHTDYIFELFFHFGEDKEITFSEMDVYMPLFFWYSGEYLPSGLTGEDGDLRVSYGYFFDAEYTLPIPDSFVPTHNMDVYVAVADVSEIIGDYEIVSEGHSSLRLTLNADGTFTYSDAGKTSSAVYRYDGTNLILENARLARYSTLTSTGIGKYQLYSFCGRMEDQKLEIIGGIYETEDSDGRSSEVVFYTEENPLVAISCESALTGSYTDGKVSYTFYADGTGIRCEGTAVEDLTYVRKKNQLQVTYAGTTQEGTVSDNGITLSGRLLKKPDEFVGSWTVDSKANKVYTFDGAGNWSYVYYGYQKNSISRVIYERTSGTYKVGKNGTITLTGGMKGSAVLQENALVLTVDSKQISCHRDGGWYGTWVYSEYGLTLKLSGVGADGSGIARVEFLHPNETLEFYDLTYALDDLQDDVICLYYDSEVFGYMTYLPTKDTLNATMYVGTMNSFMQNVDLCRLDEFEGDWVGEKNGLPELSFDGYGSYIGNVTIGDTVVSYKLDEATLSGSFVYNQKVYLISYSEADQTMTLTEGAIDTVYQRKDSFGSLTLTDTDGKIYTFDGRGNLSERGTMTVLSSAGKVVSYSYRISGDGLTIYQGSKNVGSLSADRSVGEYRLKLSGASSVNLRIRSRYTGEWAMSGSATSMTIGSMDLNGKMQGIVNETDVEFTLLEDDTLSFEFGGTVFYVTPVGSTNVVISQYKDWYLYDDQIVCSPIDEMFGTWKNSLGAAYQFDGMSGSTLISGAAQSGVLGENGISNPISYAYAYNNGQYILWTISETTGETVIYRIVFCDPSTRRAYVNGDRAFTVEEGDRLYKMEAEDTESEITYFFDGFGKGSASDGTTFDYRVLSIDYENGTVSAEMTINGEKWNATIDFFTSPCQLTKTKV